MTTRRTWTNRFKETFAMMLIGDGVLAAVEPERHVDLWLDGPRWWRALMIPFAKRPGMTRALGLLEVGAGLWLAANQKRER